MTYKEKENKVYEAIRAKYGYGNEGDELVGFVMDLCDHYEAMGGGDKY